VYLMALFQLISLHSAERGVKMIMNFEGDGLAYFKILHGYLPGNSQ